MTVRKDSQYLKEIHEFNDLKNDSRKYIKFLDSLEDYFKKNKTLGWQEEIQSERFKSKVDINLDFVYKKLLNNKPIYAEEKYALLLFSKTRMVENIVIKEKISA